MSEPINPEVMPPERAPVGAPTLTPVRGVTPVSPDAPMVGSDGTVDMGVGASAAALEAIYPQTRDDNLRTAAHTAFIKGGKLVEISKTLGIDLNVVSYWASVGGWIKARAMLLAAREGEENLALTEMRIEQRKTLLERHLRTGKRIRDKVDESLERARDKDLTASELKLLAEASASAAASDGRALGLCENGALSDALGADGKAGGPAAKTPLVLVFQGGLPEVQVRR